jgi:hypothetical protein
VIGKAVKFVECPSPVVLANEHTSLQKAYKTDVLGPKREQPPSSPLPLSEDLLLRLVVLDDAPRPSYTGDQVDGRMPGSAAL